MTELTATRLSPYWAAAGRPVFVSETAARLVLRFLLRGRSEPARGRHRALRRVRRLPRRAEGGRAVTAIEWTDATWNPATGCTKVSPGCARCYIARQAPMRAAHRLFERGRIPVWLHPERLERPLRWRRPRRVFVNSMSDVFHEDIPAEFIREMFAVMVEAHWHAFQVLTKRPERMVELAPSLPWPANVWLGATIENRRFVDRAELLRSVPVAVRFISAEPLLGPLDGLDLAGISWMIAGGESGPGIDRCAPSGSAHFATAAWLRASRSSSSSRLRHSRPDDPNPVPGLPAGSPFRVFCCRDRQAELHRRFFDRDRLPLPAGTRPGALSGHYTRLPVLRDPPTSAGPSSRRPFVLRPTGRSRPEPSRSPWVKR
jgi:protein gp37